MSYIWTVKVLSALWFAGEADGIRWCYELAEYTWWCLLCFGRLLQSSRLQLHFVLLFLFHWLWISLYIAEFLSINALHWDQSFVKEFFGSTTIARLSYSLLYALAWNKTGVEFSFVYGCGLRNNGFIALATSSGKHNVTVWRPSVCPICYV